MRTGNTYLVVLCVIVVVVVVGLGAWTMRGSADGAAEAASVTSHGWILDHDEGWAVAEREGKPVIMLFTADWCPPCRKLKKDVLTDGQVRQFLAAHFVLIKIDLTERAGPGDAVAEHYEVGLIPTILGFDEDGEFGGRFRADRNKHAFLSWAKRLRASGGDAE